MSKRTLIAIAALMLLGCSDAVSEAGWASCKKACEPHRGVGYCYDNSMDPHVLCNDKTQTHWPTLETFYKFGGKSAKADAERALGVEEE